MYRLRRKPSNPFPATAGAITSIRASRETLEALEAVQAQLVEWLLQHPEKSLRAFALTITNDYTLRVVLQTFADIYNIALPSTPQRK